MDEHSSIKSLVISPKVQSCFKAFSKIDELKIKSETH